MPLTVRGGRDVVMPQRFRAGFIDEGGFFFFQAEDGIRDKLVTGVQTCALPISTSSPQETDCTAKQGNLSPAEMKLLQQLYPQFLTALCRLRSLEREHSLRMDLEEFLSRLPLPTILLRWNLKPIYQNRAARDFCAVWEKGPQEAQLTKAASPIPSEILDRCRLLKQQWAAAQRPVAPETGFKEERVRHPRSPHLRATLHLRQLSSVGVAQPHFLIECEDLRRQTAPRGGPASSRLPHLVRLTRREQEVARLVCEGRTNQEIADDACLSLPMVKKHLHAIFRKLEVTSRSRLIALMR